MSVTTAIGLCADTHYWPGAPNFVGGAGNVQCQAYSAALLAALTTDLRQAALDYVFHLGDQTCGGGTYAMPTDQFRTTLAATHAALRTTAPQVYALPGNHDSLPGAGGWRDFNELWQMQAGCGVTVDLPQARLVLVNTCGHSAAQISAAQDGDPICGWVGNEQLARVEDALSTANDRPVLLFMHQLLRPWLGEVGWRDYYAVANGAAVLDLAARYGNVAAVFQAHAHRLDVQTAPVGGRLCTFVILPALIEYPLAWVRLDIDAAACRLRLQPLLLPSARVDALRGAADPHWRAGEPAWRDWTIVLGCD
jgi:3',5'-cyclic AMP phosphodiesterase CpdA